MCQTTAPDISEHGEAAASHRHHFRSTNPEEPLENCPRKFESWDEFEAGMSEFCAVTYQPFRKHSSVGVNSRNSIIAGNNDGGQPLPDGFHFYSMRSQYTHCRMLVYRDGGLQVRSALRHTGCTARLSATLKVTLSRLGCCWTRSLLQPHSQRGTPFA